MAPIEENKEFGRREMINSPPNANNSNKDTIINSVNKNTVLEFESTSKKVR